MLTKKGNVPDKPYAAALGFIGNGEKRFPWQQGVDLDEIGTLLLKIRHRGPTRSPTMSGWAMKWESTCRIRGPAVDSP